MVAYTDITERKAQAAEVHRLNEELHARLDELAASRARIVTAGDVARRRLERNLHDGAQQRLVALSLSLRLALAKLDSDPRGSTRCPSDSSEELSLALDELRELARGLHPAILSEQGLRAAVETLARRVPIPVDASDITAERLPEPIEAAAYYLIAEALTNVTKYAEASTAARPGLRDADACRRRGVRRRRRRRRRGRRVRPQGSRRPRRGTRGHVSRSRARRRGKRLRAEIPMAEPGVERRAAVSGGIPATVLLRPVDFGEAGRAHLPLRRSGARTSRGSSATSCSGGAAARSAEGSTARRARIAHGCRSSRSRARSRAARGLRRSRSRCPSWRP